MSNGLRLTPAQFAALSTARSVSTKTGSTMQMPKLEQAKPKRQVASSLRKQGYTVRRFHIHYTIYSSRLMDQENLCTKYATDALIDEGVIDADDWGYLTVSLDQIKCKKGEERMEALITLKP